MASSNPLNRIRSYYRTHQMRIDSILTAAIFLFCVIIMITGIEVMGAVVMVGIWCVILALTDSLMLCLAPMLLTSVFVTKCYNSFDTFIGYLWLVIPLAAALIIHFLRFHPKCKLGLSFYGLCGISLSLLLGGLGTITPEDYWNPITLYYSVGLGLGMMAVYVIFAPYVKYERGKPKLLFICLYLMGILAILSVALVYLTHYLTVPTPTERPSFQASNNIATMLMITLPIPCYYASRNRWHFLSFFAMYGTLLLTGSRGGVLLGTVEMVLCLVILLIADHRSRLWYGIFIAVILPFIVFALKPFLTSLSLFNVMLSNEQGGTWYERVFNTFVREKEARSRMLKRLPQDFAANRLFGRGIGYSGLKYYSPKKGAMHWYHMWLPQVIGSLGTVGFLTFFSNLFLRLAVVLRRKNLYSVVAGLSYLGLFLMSQVNPGEFCPLPYAMIAVLLFASLD